MLIQQTSLKSILYISCLFSIFDRVILHPVSRQYKSSTCVCTFSIVWHLHTGQHVKAGMFSGHISYWLHRQPGTQGRTPDTLGAGGSRGRMERGYPRSCDTADGSAGRQLEHTAPHRSQD
jgi:hypothetical protein